MEPPCKKYLWRNGGVFAHALNTLLKIAKHDKVIKLPNKRVSSLPVTVVTMPPDTKKPCNGSVPRALPTPASAAPTPVPAAPTTAPAAPMTVPAAPTPACNGDSAAVSDRDSPTGDPVLVQTNPVKKRPQDFQFGKAIGEGSFSQVFLVRDIKTKRDYAIKVCEKIHLIKEKKTGQVTREKNALNILGEAGAPFIVRLYCTFQTPEQLFFVLTYARNGELLLHINRLKQMSLVCARFYAAEIVVALEHLARHNIIHRDLKPENILLDENMHILITDFGSSKIIHTPNSGTESDEEQGMRERTNSFVGTAQYISPELLRDKRASFSSDLWALGCILYQMLTGYPPFQSRSEYMIFQKIQKLEYEFPEAFDPMAKDLIQKLLVLDPSHRLGASDSEGYPSLRNHPFFSGITWDTLGTTTPPCMYSNSDVQPPAVINPDDWLPESLKPGLDRCQLSRLLGLDHGAVAPQPPVETKPPSRRKSYMQGLTEEEIQRRLQLQKTENKWHDLVEGNLIIKQGLIEKRKMNSVGGLLKRRRMLFLTLGPHLYYADPYSGTLKGEIRWTPDLKLEPRTFRNFFLHCQDSRGDRTYSMTDPNSDALEWIRAIDEMHQAVFGQKAVPS